MADDMTPMERVVVAEHERRQAVQRAEQAEAERDAVLRHDEEAVRQLNAAEADIGAWRDLAAATQRRADRLLQRAQQAEAATARVRAAIGRRRTEVAEFEAEHEPSAWSDAVTVTCARIEDALRPLPDPIAIRMPAPTDTTGETETPDGG
jgi:chromosome segregation ATPase